MTSLPSSLAGLLVSALVPAPVHTAAALLPTLKTPALSMASLSPAQLQAVRETILRAFGRGPTADELSFYGSMIERYFPQYEPSWVSVAVAEQAARYGGDGSAAMRDATYLTQNPDVAPHVFQSSAFRTGREHWVLAGRNEGRAYPGESPAAAVGGAPSTEMTPVGTLAQIDVSPPGLGLILVGGLILGLFARAQKWL